MSVFFHRTYGPTRINTVQINQSVLGYPVPVLMGKGKIQQTILWMDDFKAKLVNTQSGKGFGGKEGLQYVYSEDVLAALCDGGPIGILGVGDVWSGQSWLRNTTTLEAYTISGASPSYTPVNAANMTADHGVGYTTTINATYPDLASETPTSINADILVPMKRVPYVAGQTLAAKTYSVDSNNVYYFSGADDGITVQLYYTFALRDVTRQQIALVPSGLNVVIAGDLPFTADNGVIYFSTGDTDNPLNGQPLTRVDGTPTEAGTYSVDYGSYTVSGHPGSWTVTVNRAANYTFAAADVNQEIQITYQLDNSTTLPAGTQTSLSFELIVGTPKDAPAALLSTNYPSAALGYGGIAKVLYAPMDLGYGAQIQQNIFEVLTGDLWGAGIADCNPAQCILQVLTNHVWGLGAGPIPFPTSAIDLSGTWGTPTPSGVAQAGSAAANWFAANSFFISPTLDRQDTAASAIGRWLEAGMCAAFMSEGLMKLVAYGDTSAAANGATWVAPSAFAAELDDTCYVGKGTNQDPVKISSSPWTEAFNKVQINWSNRENQYAPEITPAEDKGAVMRYGSRIEDPQSYDFITTLAAARFAGSVRVKRSVYTRNTYKFTLPFRFGYLEPMDIVSLTTNSAWNSSANNTLQLISCPVRITKIVDNPNGTYDVSAEDLISGAHTPDGFSKSVSTPNTSPNQFADPGDTVPVFFDGPLALKIYDGNELWIGAAGSTFAWGGCNVYASPDGDKYALIGTIKTPARLGTLNAAFPIGSDPDTVNSLIVNLQPDSAALEPGTQTDADNAVTLCYVDGELIAYSASALSGTDQYTLSTYTRRGLMGTAAAAHASGSKFLRLDNAVLQYPYDASWIGKTIYLKFQSFNSFGNALQDMSTLTAYTITPGGTQYPAPPTVTVSQSTTYSGSGSKTASNGLVDGNAIATVYVTVSWSWSANFPAPSGFNVALFEGTDPTDTSKYIAPVMTVGASARSYTFAVTPNNTMTDVNAAVEAVYA